MRGTQKAGYNHDIIASLSSLIIALYTKELKIELEECISLTVVSSENSVVIPARLYKVLIRMLFKLSE